MTGTPRAATPQGAAILIPAAGGSTRMRGRDKLLEPVRGRTLLADRVAAALSAIDCSHDAGRGLGVVVTLPPRDVAPGRWKVLQGSPAHLVEVTDHRAGLSASLAAGIRALAQDCTGAMILPADMPDITEEDIAALLEAFDGETILRGACADGRPGHPVLFPLSDFAALSGVTGDQGGRDVLRSARDRIRHIPLPGEHALTDLDTPEDWAAWRARRA